MIIRRLALPLIALAACHSPSASRFSGQTDYLSAVPPGGSGITELAQSGTANGGAAAPTAAPTDSAGSSAPRTVQETDIYAVDGNRLYALSAYRGLLVFDITNPDTPTLLGRSAIFGTPQEMTVNAGIASIVVSDWFGELDDGTPYSGSIVRSVDMTNPQSPTVLGEALLGGSVSDVRVVGSVIYAVSVDYGTMYGWALGGVATGGALPARDDATYPQVLVTSVDISNGATQVAQKVYPGWSGVFHVTANAVLLASDAGDAGTALTYLDISDPHGAVTQRGSINVAGHLQTWGADGGRWNIDFADGVHAHALACGAQYCDNQSGLILSTADFSNPDAPVLASSLSIASIGWVPAARFDGTHLYLSPNGNWTSATTPIQIYDLATPASPTLKGTAQVNGDVWLFMPSGNQLFALASDPQNDGLSVAELDVTDPTNPKVLGQAAFGSDWAWSPAQGTFKAFITDSADSLIALPFSGWTGTTYNNGIQLLSDAGDTVTALGAAQTSGWVQRGIFANGRIDALSDISLGVIDYSVPTAPRTVTEVTLARNITALQLVGENIAELDEDYFGNDPHVTLRVLPQSAADDPSSNAPALMLDGQNGRLFANGTFAYVVTDVSTKVTCTGVVNPTTVQGADCQAVTERVQVIDLSSGTPQKRGQIDLPPAPGYYGGLGFQPFDWYEGADVAALGDALAFRRWTGWDENGASQAPLYLVDLSNPDSPSVASTTLVTEPHAWWGQLRAVGDKLWVSEYVWDSPYGTGQGYVRYYIQNIDISHRSTPTPGPRVNTPGVLIGGSATDSNVLYTLDWRWNGNQTQSWLNAVRVQGNKAAFVGGVSLKGDSGPVFISGTHAYTSVDNFDGNSVSVALHDIDLSNPAAPKDFAAAPAAGWGWLVDIQGDRALVQSGWSGEGFDLYKLNTAAAPSYDRFVRTSGWWLQSAARQAQTLFVASGYWGIQRINL